MSTKSPSAFPSTAGDLFYARLASDLDDLDVNAALALLARLVMLLGAEIPDFDRLSELYDRAVEAGLRTPPDDGGSAAEVEGGRKSL